MCSVYSVDCTCGLYVWTVCLDCMFGLCVEGELAPLMRKSRIFLCRKMNSCLVCRSGHF